MKGIKIFWYVNFDRHITTKSFLVKEVNCLWCEANAITNSPSIDESFMLKRNCARKQSSHSIHYNIGHYCLLEFGKRNMFVLVNSVCILTFRNKDKCVSFVKRKNLVFLEKLSYNIHNILVYDVPIMLEEESTKAIWCWSTVFS